MRPPRAALLLLLGLVSAGLGCDQLQWQALRVYLAANPHLEDGPQAYTARSEALTLMPVVEGLEFPWDMTFLSAREGLVTEKPGRLSRVDLETGERRLIAGVPEVKFAGQGGLHGVELHPDFALNGVLYLAYAIRVGEKGTTRLARARLVGDELVDLEVLFTAEPAGTRNIHYGGALEFGADGKLYLSVGERGQREFAQRLDVDLGKIHRFEPDGGVPADNPFLNRPGAHPSIFSYGHRNPQGLVRHPETGEIWSVEHGPQGGDEVNIVRAGRNYGWPLITYGEEYGGGKIGETHAEGLEQPIYYWVPSIATGGMAFYTGDDLHSWKGNLFVAGLRKTLLARLALDGERVTEVESLFADLWLRIRGVAQAPDQRLYVLSENGKIFRIERAAPELDTARRGRAMASRPSHKYLGRQAPAFDPISALRNLDVAAAMPAVSRLDGDSVACCVGLRPPCLGPNSGP